MGDDNTIVGTCLREMEEEIGIRQENVTVLGTLRCNWSEVARITGVAVTPVVCFVGELGDGGTATTTTTSTNKRTLSQATNTASRDSNSDGREVEHDVASSSSRTKIVLNYSEVSECFTVSIASLMDKSKWIHRDDCTPVFIGGPYIIWGLTGYIVDQFVKDILVRYTGTGQHRFNNM
jgi:nudix motif 8